MSERWKDWLAQAKRNSNHARNARDDGDYEWSCFSAQQAAEKNGIFEGIFKFFV